MTLASDLSAKNDITLLLFFNLEEAKYNLSRLPKNVKIQYVYKRKIKFLSQERKLYTIFSYFLSPLISLFTYFKVKTYIYDIVHVNLTLPSVYLIYFKCLKTLFRTKEYYVQTFHSNIHLLKGVSKFLNIISWKFPDYFVYEIYKNEIEKFRPILKNKPIGYIPFGYCKKLKDDGQESKDMPAFLPFDIPKDYKVFMTISRVRFFEKRIHIMIEAMSIYRQSNDKFVFVIAGDGEDMNRAKNLVGEYGLEEYVVFMGYVDNPESIARFADVFLVAVVGGNTGVSGMQAISNGRSVIGVQTILDYKDDSVAKMLSSYDAEGVASILRQFDNSLFAEEYKLSMIEIADENCINERQFSKCYLSLYSKILCGDNASD